MKTSALQPPLPASRAPRGPHPQAASATDGTGAEARAGLDPRPLPVKNEKSESINIVQSPNQGDILLSHSTFLSDQPGPTSGAALGGPEL